MFGKLPSEIRDQAGIFDLMVANTLMSWENSKVDEMSGKKPVPTMSQEEMMSILKTVKKN